MQSSQRVLVVNNLPNVQLQVQIFSSSDFCVIVKLKEKLVLLVLTVVWFQVCHIANVVSHYLAVAVAVATHCVCVLCECKK